MNVFKIMCYTPLICIALAFFTGLLFKYLQKRDMNVDYTGKEILYYLQNINGINYIIIPYLFWETGKLAAIKNAFADYIEFGGQRYEIELLYTGQNHSRRPGDYLPEGFYRDCSSVVKRIEPKSVNYGNVNNMYVDGDNNQISIQQGQYSYIEKELQEFIRAEKDLSDFDKEALQSFLYQLSKGAPNRSTANKVIDILNKFLPFTTAIINMLKALAF